MHTATQTPGELSSFILPVIVVSVTLNILFIAAIIVLIVIVIITARKKSGKVWYACLFICTNVVLINLRYCAVQKSSPA